MATRTLAIVLARRGSKGLPGKNIREVAGKPCVLWTLDDARRARTVDRVVLSTDDPEAQRLAAGLGVDVVARPDALASDTAPVDDAARHALEALGPEETADAIVLLYANVPVRPDGLIDAVVARLRESGAHSAQSYAPVGKHHPWWTCVVDDSGDVRPWEGDVLNHGVHRRQDLPPAHVPDGGALAVTREALTPGVPGAPEGPHRFLGTRYAGVVTDRGAVIDIDDEIDLHVADAVLRTSRRGPVA